MAKSAAVANGNWSTAGTWESIVNTPSQHLTTNITLNTTLYTAAFTAPNTTDAATGVALYLATIGTAGTVTLTLQQNSAGWVDCSPACTGNFNVATLYASNASAFHQWINVRAGTPFTYASTSAGYYRWKITVASMSGTTSAAADSGGSNLSYLTTSSATGVPGSTDDVWIFSTASVDGTQTIGSGASTTVFASQPMRIAATGTAFWSVNVGYGGELNYDDTAAATLNCNGNLCVSSGGTFRMDDKSGGARTYLATLSFTPTTGGDYGFGFYGSCTISCIGVAKTTTSLWRTKPNANWAIAEGTTGQEAVVADTVNWVVNDELVIAPTGASTQTEYKFVKTVATGNTFTFSATAGGGESGLTYAHTTDAWVVNLTRNVVITTNDTTKGWYMYGAASTNTVTFNWCRFENTGSTVTANKYYIMTQSTVAYANVNYCVVYNMVNGGMQFTVSSYVDTFAGLVFTKFTGTPAQYSLYLNAARSKTFNDLMMINCYNGFSCSNSAVGITMNSPIAIAAGQSATQYNAAFVINTLNSNYNNLEAHFCRTGISTGASNAGNTFYQPLLGTKGANLSYDVLSYNTTYATWTLDTPYTVTGDLAVYGTQTMIPGTKICYWKVGGDITDYRSFFNEGHFHSISSATKLQAKTWILGSTLTNQYKYDTGTISGSKVYVSVNCQIVNAAYYAGAHTNPNLTVSYDGGTVSSASTSTDSTDVQNLSVIITPTTDNNFIYPILSQASAASIANSEVDWDSLVVNYRPYGYTFQEFALTLYKTTDDIQGKITTPVTNPYITVSNSATVGAYSEFTINHATQTCTITADTTMAKLYDYSQYDLGLDANRGYTAWYTTLDGTNFTSTYDIVLNTGVDLTGGGTIDVGAGTFTKTGTATYDGIIIYSASREVHLSLAGLVAGSTVQVYDNDNTTELYNDVVAGTSLDYVFTYTADTELRIRVRKAGYIPYEYTGNILETGLSLNVAQEVDSVYVANAIDGSTVTEFSLSGATVKIYVDDPTNATTGQRMYNWYMYAIATTTYIGIQPNDITAQTAWSYQLADAILLYNQDAVNPIFIEGANINNVSSNGQVIDTAGGMININGYFPFNSASDVGSAVADNADFKLSNLLIKDKLS